MSFLSENNKQHKENIDKVCTFLHEIGISVNVQEGVNGFLNHIIIKDGGLIIDPICCIMNILHEAGHIATMPKLYRHLMNDNVTAAMKYAYEDIDKMNLPLDHPLQRAILQASEQEAITWGWIAGRHLNFAPNIIFSNKEEKFAFEGEAEEVRRNHELIRFPLGAHGLAAGGFCQVGILNPYNPLPQYPKLIRWLQI